MGLALNRSDRLMAFAQETLDLLEIRDLTTAVVSTIASLLLGVLAVLVGAMLGRLV